MKYLPSFKATNTWNLVFCIDAKVSITSVVLSLFQIFSRWARKLVQETLKSAASNSRCGPDAVRIDHPRRR